MKDSTTNTRNVRCVAFVLALLTLGQLGWLEARLDSALRALIAMAMHPHQGPPPVLSGDSRRLGANFTNGNVFLKLVVTPKANAPSLASHSFFDYQEYYLSDWYYRTSFELYPRRVLIGPPTKVINNGWDMMQDVFTPDDAWLQAHDVQSILTLGFDKDGRSLPPQWVPVLPLKGGAP